MQLVREEAGKIVFWAQVHVFKSEAVSVLSENVQKLRFLVLVCLDQVVIGADENPAVRFLI